MHRFGSIGAYERRQRLRRAAPGHFETLESKTHFPQSGHSRTDMIFENGDSRRTPWGSHEARIQRTFTMLHFLGRVCVGLTYVSLGDKDKAIANLKSYTARVPGDENAARTLDAVINGKIEIRQLKASP
jgi:hypothetical protein